jgi:AcrR family transcriptional regulator
MGHAKKQKVKTNDVSDKKDVRERLLEAAEALFCDKGFSATSVRDLAAKAGCNIASVNYYFGGKEQLYKELWRQYLVRMRDVRLSGIDKVMSESGGKPSLEELLKAFAYAFLGPFLDEPRASRLMKLMAREMLDQHLPANMFIDDVIMPTMTAMGTALVSICPSLDKNLIPHSLFSVVGQLIHLVRVKAMFEEVPNAHFPTFDLAAGVDHIVRFSAAGIRAYAHEQEKEDNNG